MDFDSPDAEQDFPGLYAESKSSVGDDESRKILSVKKKKDKDKGYKTFEEDGSGGSCEDVNKVLSSRRFKFGKSSSKSVSTASKPVKVKLFGIDLKEVVQRNPDAEKPLLPKFLSKALSYLEEESKPGLNYYKGTSHFKSKIHALRHSLNYGEELSLQEPQIVAGLVKLFLRELPGHILGTTIEMKLEETKLSQKKTQKIQNLYAKELNDVNKAVFERLVLHMDIIGIDLTPLLKVSQKSLSLLRPLMAPLALEDELRVEEARLARMHTMLAKAKESKDKSKAKDTEENLWEAQRNVTQLKRKLKQINSVGNVEEKEVELNCEERKEESDDEEKPAENTEQPQQNEAEVPRKDHPEPPQTTVVPEPDPAIQPEPEEKAQEAPPKSDLEPTVPIQNKISPAPEPKHDQILQPLPAPPVQGKIETVDDIPNVFSEPEPFQPSFDSFDSTAFEKPEALTGKPFDDAELKRIQQEWKKEITEQVELLRLKEEYRRKIRDEHKQIKMIQMVRNHKSRMAPIKPYQDPLINMSTEKLQEVWHRFVESNQNLARESQALADRVFEERLNIIQLKSAQQSAGVC